MYKNEFIYIYIYTAAKPPVIPLMNNYPGVRHVLRTIA